MPRGGLNNGKILGGLNTKASPVGLPLPYGEVVRNVRYFEGEPHRRPGMRRVAAVAASSTGALDLAPSASTDDVYVTIPLKTQVHVLPSQFTIDITFNPDVDHSANAHIYSFQTIDAVSPWSLEWTVDQTILFTFIDEDDTTTTLESGAYNTNTTLSVRIVRNRNVMKMVVNGVVVASTNTVHKTNSSAIPTTALILGAQSPGTDSDDSQFDGTIDEFRIFHMAIEDGQAHAFCEFPNPRHPALMGYYRFEDNGTLVVDESRWGNHGGITGSGYSYVTGLVTSLAPITGVHYYNNVRGSAKVLLVANKSFMESTIV